jgi:amino acid transporter
MADIIGSLNPITRVAAALRELSRAPPPLPPPLQPPPAAWPPARAAAGAAKPEQPPPPSSELRRGLSAFANFALTLTAVGVLPSICTGWAPAMATGGPAVILAAWFVVGTFTTLTGVAMAELNAAYPSAGSVYYWAARLAPRRHAALAAYACGVLNLVGNAAGNAAFALGFANFVSKAVQLRGWVDGVGPPPQAEPLSQGGVVAVAIAVSVCWAALNALRIDQLGLVQNLAALWQVGATVVIVAVVLGAPQRDPDVPRDWVWSARYSGTGLEDGNQYSSYVALLGLLNALFAFCVRDWRGEASALPLVPPNFCRLSTLRPPSPSLPPLPPLHCPGH